MKKIKNRIQRIQAIESALEDVENNGKKFGTKNVQLRTRNIPLSIITIPIEYLMYRIQNTRTRRQQLRYLKNHPDLPNSIFTDPESQRAQDAQDSILLDMIDATGKDFINDLIERGQDDPAIITYDGYLINGNRRTAALRRIGKEYLDCVVLPQNLSQKEIYDLEIDLQMSQDFKEPYHWINELIDIEEGLKEYDESREEIARRLRIKLAELNSKLRMKLIVDKYLQWKAIPGEYDCENLDDSEQDFIELEKETRRTKYNSNPYMLDQVEKAAFHFVDSKPKKGRSYAWERDLFNNFEEVYDLMKQQLKGDENKPLQQLGGASAGLLDSLILDNSNNTVDIFGNAENSKNISIILQDTIKDVKAKNSEKKDLEAVYEAVSDALRQLQGLAIYKSTAKIDSIHNKLEEIISISSDLLTQAKKYKK